MSELRRRVRRFVMRHVGGSAVVLVYHRVAALERDPQLLAVSPDNFDSQMKMLADRHRVIPLADLLTALRERSVPSRAVVVTFDDGYADNLLAAEPALARHEVPATVFVSSGCCADTSGFWWDEVERLVLDSGTLPDVVRIALPSSQFERRLGLDTDSEEQSAASLQSWNITLPPRSARLRLYVELCDFIRPLAAQDRAEALLQLQRLVDAPPPARATHRPLTQTEIARLDSSAWVEVGGHTANHPVLAALSPEDQHAEIVEDQGALEAACGHQIRAFSYPYGDLETYTDETVGIVREAGYKGACSNHPGIVKRWTDPYRIPRNLVRDWDAGTLAAMIDGWFDDPR